MSFEHWLVVISTLVSLSGASVYIRDTLKGFSKPNRVTWLMWALAPMIGTVVAISAQADLWVTSRVFLAGFIPLLVFTASFVNPGSYWKLTRLDLICGIFSALALIVWIVADSSRLAILLVVIGDGFAALPTILKAWNYPETETGLTYIASFLSVILIIPSISEWSVENSAFQIYLLVVNTFLIFAVYRHRLTKRFLL